MSEGHGVPVSVSIPLAKSMSVCYLSLGVPSGVRTMRRRRETIGL